MNIVLSSNTRITPYSSMDNIVDVNDILLETDCPFLTPHPFRGLENSPKYIGLTAKEIAKIKNITLDSLAHQTSINARRFFNIENIEE